MKRTRLFALFGSLCLILAVVVTLSYGVLPAIADKPQDELPPGIEKKIIEEEVEPLIPYEDGVPLIPQISPVIILQGSDYDMGYQFSSQITKIYGTFALERLQLDFTEEEIAALKAYQWYIEEYTPEFIDFFKGMAGGATDAGIELSYTQALAYYCKGWGGVATYPGTEPAESQEESLPPSCSGFAAWGSATKDGKLIAAGSVDGWLRPTSIVVALPEAGNSYIIGYSLPDGPTVTHPGMNNKGLTYAHHGAGVSGNEARGYGVPGNLMTLHTLRFADNCEQALEMQLAYPTRAGGLWADVSGDAFDIECRDPLVVRRAGDHGEEDFLYSTNNVLDTSMEIRPFLAAGAGHGLGWPINYFPHGGWNLDDMNTVRRNLYIWNQLHNYHGEVDLEFAKMMWRMPSPAPDYPTLEEAEKDLKLPNYAARWDTYIGNLGNDTLGIVRPDNGDEGLYYTCKGSPARQAEPLTQDYYWLPVGATHTFYQLQLAADPAAIVQAAAKQALFDLYDANKELRKLNYWDAPYAPLNEIFDKAAAQTQVGDYYLALASRTTGNEQVCNYGLAAYAYARSQAYARQVYQSLVPPADDPTDLGLDEWFGSWGEWETAPDGDDASHNP